MIRGYVPLSDIDPSHEILHKQLFDYGLAVVNKIFTTVPTVNDVPKGYGAWYEGTSGISNKVRRLYINFFGTMTWIDLQE